jgi:hypothetical protein
MVCAGTLVCINATSAASMIGVNKIFGKCFIFSPTKITFKTFPNASFYFLVYSSSRSTVENFLPGCKASRRAAEKSFERAGI